MGFNNWNDNNWTYGDVGGTQLSTAMLMKSGQTTSYRSGDDGDSEAGRSVDFFTLAENNPFANTNRFTDENGAQTFAADIMIDWSTFDGTNVLGWSRIPYGQDIWDGAIDDAVAFSTGAYTSGWLVANVPQYVSLNNFEQENGLDWSPLNINQNGFEFWTSNTRTNNTSNAYYIVFESAFYISDNHKAFGSYYYLINRNFTWNGTSLD